MKKVMILVFILVILLASCQATPSTKSVVQKQNILEVIEEPIASIEPYNAPKSWKEEKVVEVSDLIVDINAAIQIPESGLLPVAKIESIDIDDKMALRIMNTLFSGQKVYTGDGIKTRLEIEEEILEAQAALASIDNEEMDSEEIREVRRNMLQEKLKSLTESLIDAPEEHNFTEAEFINIGNGVWDLRGFAQMNKDIPANIFITKSDSNLFNNVVYYNLNQTETITPHGNFRFNINMDDNKNINNLRGLNTSYEEAKQIADNIVNTIGASDLLLSAVSSRIIETTHVKFNECPQCYIFHYTKCINDASVTYNNKISTTPDGYAAPWRYESILIAIDDSGVIYFEWNAPSTVKEVIASAVQLIEFNDVLDVFKQQFAACHIWSEYEGDVISRHVVIDEVILGLMRVATKDSADEFLLIPVWDFYGYTTLKYSDQSKTQWILDENNEYTFRDYRESYLTINAIDGSIIDRSLGY